MTSAASRDGLPVGRLIRLMFVLWLAGVAMRMTILAMPPVIPQVHDELHLSETQVGLLIGLPLNFFMLPKIAGAKATAADAVKPHIPIDRTMILLAFTFAAGWTVTGAMAAHMPRILEAGGATAVQAVAAGTAGYELLRVGVLTRHVQAAVRCGVDVVGQEIHRCRRALTAADARHADHGAAEEPVEVQPSAVARDRHAVVTGDALARQRRETTAGLPLVHGAGVLPASDLGHELWILGIKGAGDNEAFARQRHHGIEPDTVREYRAAGPTELGLGAARVDGVEESEARPAAGISSFRIEGAW